MFITTLKIGFSNFWGVFFEVRNSVVITWNDCFDHVQGFEVLKGSWSLRTSGFSSFHASSFASPWEGHTRTVFRTRSVIGTFPWWCLNGTLLGDCKGATRSAFLLCFFPPKIIFFFWLNGWVSVLLKKRVAHSSIFSEMKYFRSLVMSPVTSTTASQSWFGKSDPTNLYIYPSWRQRAAEF